MWDDILNKPRHRVNLHEIWDLSSRLEFKAQWHFIIPGGFFQVSCPRFCFEMKETEPEHIND